MIRRRARNVEIAYGHTNRISGQERGCKPNGRKPKIGKKIHLIDSYFDTRKIYNALSNTTCMTNLNDNKHYVIIIAVRFECKTRGLDNDLKIPTLTRLTESCYL